MSEDRSSIVARPPTQGLVIAAWILTFLIPPIGLILGIILAAKSRTGHGVGTMVVSVIWALFVVTLSVGAYHDAYNTGENLDLTNIQRKLDQRNR